MNNGRTDSSYQTDMEKIYIENIITKLTFMTVFIIEYIIKTTIVYDNDDELKLTPAVAAVAKMAMATNVAVERHQFFSPQKILTTTNLVARDLELML